MIQLKKNARLSHLSRNYSDVLTKRLMENPLSLLQWAPPLVVSSSNLEMSEQKQNNRNYNTTNEEFSVKSSKQKMHQSDDDE
jgi:hypothetical protein